MFNLGWQEVVLILGVLLLIFGPTKLPGIARELGKVVHEFSRASSGMVEAVTSAPSSSSMADEGNRAIMDVARKLNINIQGKTIGEIASEISIKIGEKKKEGLVTEREEE